MEMMRDQKTGPGGAGAAPGGSGRWSVVWGIGMLAIFVGERMIGSGSGRTVATAAGFLLLIGAMVARFVRAGKAAPDRRRLENTLLALYALGLAAVLLYVMQSDLWSSAFDHPLEKNWPKLSTVLAVLWPVAWVAAAWPILLVELAHVEMARAPKLELGRIRNAMLSGFGVAAVLVAAFAFSYVASERDKKVDLAYFRTSRPGEVTRRITRNLDQPIEVAVFFPSPNEVRDEVDDYLNDLAKESNQLKVTHYDFDIDPAKAKEYGVTTNGILVFVRGSRHEQLGLPKDIESAKAGLKILDKEVQQRLMTIVKPPRSVGFTIGHGERTWERGETDTDKRPGVAMLRDILIDQNYTNRTVSAADGLMTDVPKDVTVLAIIGPRKPFQPEELAAVNRFIDGGGRVLIALDPENNVDMHEVLGPLNLEFKAEPLANEAVFARRMEQKISDRANLITATYSSSPAVSTLARFGQRAPIVLPGAGWINTKKDRTAVIPVDAAIKAHYATFVDKNGNFTQDPGEDKRQWELAATAVKKDARVFVIADSDWCSDETIKVAANGGLALDVIHWLMGDESFSGQTSTETDVKIVHSRKQDVGWFYSTIFLAPALVIGAGVALTRKSRRKRRQAGGSDKRSAAPPPPSPPPAAGPPGGAP
jgi:gliding motility-associatede transport system auxiliary component